MPIRPLSSQGLRTRQARRCLSISRRHQAAAALLGMAMVLSAHAGNPGYDRPGLGFTPAVLQAGAVTWEQGLPDWSRADGASLYNADSLLRVGIGGPFELQFGTSYNRLSTRAQDVWGRGDSSLGVKFALPASGAFSWGLLGSVVFTDGARNLRAEDRQYLLGGVLNWQLDPRDTLGAYLETVRSAGHGAHLVAFNAGRALTSSLGAYIEVAWQYAAGVGNGSMAGAGVAWLVTPRVQLDASFRHRIDGDADRWQAGVGVSAYFGPL